MIIADLFRKWWSWILLITLFFGVVYWGVKYTDSSSEIKIATAGRGGFYFKFGTILKKQIEKNSDLTVRILETKGSVHNRSLLLSGKADFAIMQAGAMSMNNLEAVAPLWSDFVQIVVKRNSVIKSLEDFRGHNVGIGSEGSGTREIAKSILQHFRIDPTHIGNNTKSIKYLIGNNALEGAIETTSLLNPNLQMLLSSGKYRLLSIDKLEGLTYHKPYFSADVIKTGVYSAVGGPLPARDVKTISTLAILASKEGKVYKEVKKILPLLYSLEINLEVPSLIKKNKIDNYNAWNLLPVHKASKGFFNPYEGVKIFSSAVETLNQYKYLIILSLLIITLLVYKIISRKRVNNEKEFEKNSKGLENWLTEMVKIETNQKEAKDMRLLKQYLNEALNVKKQGVNSVMGKEVQHSALFQAFLMECSHVIREIEWKLSILNSDKDIL